MRVRHGVTAVFDDRNLVARAGSFLEPGETLAGGLGGHVVLPRAARAEGMARAGEALGNDGGGEMPVRALDGIIRARDTIPRPRPSLVPGLKSGGGTA
jgi:hypothetical protein